MDDPFATPPSSIGPLSQFVLRENRAEGQPTTNNVIDAPAKVTPDMKSNARILLGTILRQVRPDIGEITNAMVEKFLTKYVFDQDWKTGDRIGVPSKTMVTARIDDTGTRYGVLLEAAAASGRESGRGRDRGNRAVVSGRPS